MGGLLKLIESEPAARVLDRLVVPASTGEIARRDALAPGVFPFQGFRLEELPVVEPDAVAQPEAGEEVTAIEAGSLGVARIGDTASKLVHVEPHTGSAERDRGALHLEELSAEPLTERRERPAKRRAGVLPVMLRPEERCEGITALALSGDRQVGQKRDGFPGIDGQRLTVDSRSGAARGARSSAGP